MPKAIPRYQPHNCLPWCSENCVCVSQPAYIINHLAPTIRSSIIQSPPFNPGTSSIRNLANGIPRPIQWQPRPITAQRPCTLHSGCIYHHAVGILKKEFQTCVILSAPHANIEHCDEFLRIKQAVEGCKS